MTNPRRSPILDALERFQEKVVRRSAVIACRLSRNGKHWYVGYKKRTCRWCGEPKP